MFEVVITKYRPPRESENELRICYSLNLNCPQGYLPMSQFLIDGHGGQIDNEYLSFILDCSLIEFIIWSTFREWQNVRGWSQKGKLGPWCRLVETLSFFLASFSLSGFSDVTVFVVIVDATGCCLFVIPLLSSHRSKWNEVSQPWMESSEQNRSVILEFHCNETIT